MTTPMFAWLGIVLIAIVIALAWIAATLHNLYVLLGNHLKPPKADQ